MSNDTMQAVIVQLTEQLSQARKDLEFSCDEFTAQLGEQEDALKRYELEIARIQHEASSTMNITKDRLAELQQINQQQQVSFVTHPEFFCCIVAIYSVLCPCPFQQCCTHSQPLCNSSRVTMTKSRMNCTWDIRKHNGLTFLSLLVCISVLIPVIVLSAVTINRRKPHCVLSYD